jgi:hypothetical protein
MKIKPLLVLAGGIVLLLLYVYLSYFVNPVVAILTVFTAYFIFFVIGLHLLNSFIESKNLTTFILSQGMMILGIFVILLLTYLLQAIPVKHFFDYMTAFTMSSISLAITALLIPKTRRELKDMIKEFRIVIFLTLVSTIIFFFIGLFMLIPYMFGRDVTDVQYVELETLFFVASTDLSLSAVNLLISMFKSLGIGFKKWKARKTDFNLLKRIRAFARKITFTLVLVCASIIASLINS